MGKYFTIQELTKTSTGLPNIPNKQQTSNIEMLIDVLDMIREGWTELCKKMNWGSPAIITNSGFRSDKVNNAVGGSKTSAHTTGWAIDFEPKNQKNLEFYNFVKDFLNDNNIAFDQLINEKPVNGVPSWVHLGLFNRKGQQRKQIKTIL